MSAKVTLTLLDGTQVVLTVVAPYELRVERVYDPQDLCSFGTPSYLADPVEYVVTHRRYSTYRCKSFEIRPDSTP